MAFTQLPTGGGVPDVDLITATLAKLQPDSALQQYAAMHKNDPYILSLATAESNRRKALRLAAQGQNAGQMPTVADQNIAGMAPQPVMTGAGVPLQTGSGGRVQTELPEDQGIGRLPARNIQHMADGGIAGYGDGDDVPKRNGMAMGGMFDFAQRSEPVVRMADGGMIPRYNGQTGSLTGDIPGFQNVQPREQFTQQGAPENTPLLQRIYESIGSGNKARQLALIEQKIAQGIASTEEQAFYQAEMSKKSGQPQMAAPKSVVNPDEVAMAAEKAARFKPTDKPPADKTPSAAPAPQATLPTAAPSVKQAQDLGSKFYDLKNIKGTLEQQEAQERQDILNEKEARAAKLAAFNKEQGPAMAGYEKLLKGEEMQDATDKEKAGLMSLMKGFLAMAAGESPNAATNIAKGAMVGLGDYGDALKEFKKSAKERNKAMAEIENARRAEAKGDLKDQQASEDKANDYLRASKRHGIDAIISATGKSAEVSAGLYKSMADNASANARTMMQVNAPSGVERLVGRMQTDPKFAAAYRDYASIGPDVKGDAALLAKYAGPQGQIALQMLEAEGPEGKLQAQLIRQKLQAAMLTPTSKPTGPVRD